MVCPCQELFRCLLRGEGWFFLPRVKTRAGLNRQILKVCKEDFQGFSIVSTLKKFLSAGKPGNLLIIKKYRLLHTDFHRQHSQ
jgi:hypothetical protein